MELRLYNDLQAHKEGYVAICPICKRPIHLIPLPIPPLDSDKYLPVDSNSCLYQVRIGLDLNSNSITNKCSVMNLHGFWYEATILSYSPFRINVSNLS